MISANHDIGVVLGQTATPIFSVVLGNFIGTDVTGTIPLGNADRGIHAGAPDNVIGGPGPGEGNIIAHTHITGPFQTGVGVYVPASPRTTVRGNSIFDNEGVGIDNMAGGSPDGVTPNDPGDVDTGGNALQNFPLLSSVTTGATTRIQGALHSTASTVFDLDFYGNPACANFPREFQEGSVYLGTARRRPTDPATPRSTSRSRSRRSPGHDRDHGHRPDRQHFGVLAEAGPLPWLRRPARPREERTSRSKAPTSRRARPSWSAVSRPRA